MSNIWNTQVMNHEDIHYTAEKHTQILIALLKAHGIKKIVVSPGSTNICLNGSLQNDPWFEMYSSIDERSAAYIAVGLAAESGEPVALSCTGSTASRNYIPGLTEAYYRKLPVLAITATQHLGRVGQNYSQVIDRSSPLADIVRESVTVDCVYTKEDEWACEVNINKALLALRQNGGGPAHINLVTTYSKDFSCQTLPEVTAIKLIETKDDMPSLKKYKHIAILVGEHEKWSDKLSCAVETFCGIYNAVVIASHVSNYKGDYGYNPDLISGLFQYTPETEKADLVIYIGNISRYKSGMNEKEMWRVNPDGSIRDIEKKMTCVFAMDETEFFQYYCDQEEDTVNNTYAKMWQDKYESILSKMPEVPFSAVWIAKNLSVMLPENSILHIAGSNTARAWNFFPLYKTIECYSNDGEMGIDGQVSAMIGESLSNPGKLHFGVVGDLTFFYDMNSLGNRHIGNNLRLLIANNGMGAEFKLCNHNGYEFGSDANSYIAGAGHFGNKSPDLIRHYAEDLGYEYLSASTKEEFIKNAERFTTPEITEKPMIFEAFVDIQDETDAVYAMNNIVSTPTDKAKDFAKSVIKSVAGDKGVEKVKGLLKK